jgi:hypothetical protein
MGDPKVLLAHVIAFSQIHQNSGQKITLEIATSTFMLLPKQMD